MDWQECTCRPISSAEDVEHEYLTKRKMKENQTSKAARPWKTLNCFSSFFLGAQKGNKKEKCVVDL